MARDLNKPCVVGCEDLGIDLGRGVVIVISTGQEIGKGDSVVIDGSSGKIYLGEVPIENIIRPYQNELEEITNLLV